MQEVAASTAATSFISAMSQNRQSRESEAIQLKLDELLRAVTKVRTSLVDLEDLSEKELEAFARGISPLARARASDRLEPFTQMK